MKKKYITKTQLGKLLYRTQQTLMSEYGLTKKWIDLLGEPEMLINNNYGGDPVKLFYLGKVYELIENNIEDYIKRIEKFKKLQEKRNLSKEQKEIERIRHEEELKKQYETMWEKWKGIYNNDEDLALVKAVWYMNKFIKMRLVDKSYYMVKDVWVNRNQDFLTNGQKVRYEEHPYIDDIGRTLYLHYFKISGKDFSFHSYSRPSKVSEEQGEDLPFYGEYLSEEEVKALPFRPRKLCEMVKHKLWKVN